MEMMGGWVGRPTVSTAKVSILAEYPDSPYDLLFGILVSDATALARLVLLYSILRREQPDAEQHDEVHDHVHEEVVA